MTRRCVEDQRSLPYWPKTKSSLPWSPIASPTSSSPPRASTWRAGRPVTTATARTRSLRSTSDLRGVGVDVRLVGSSTIGDSTPSKSSPTTISSARATSVGVALLGCCGGELHGQSQPRGRVVEQASTSQAASAVSTIVSRSIFIGSTASAVRPMPEVERELLGLGLEARGVVDGGGGDGAEPVVLADDLPADLGGLGRGGRCQALDAGVVEDLDVHLAALDRRLRLGRLRRRRRGAGSAVSVSWSPRPW